jgi:hypothetical protein
VCPKGQGRGKDHQPPTSTLRHENLSYKNEKKRKKNQEKEKEPSKELFRAKTITAYLIWATDRQAVSFLLMYNWTSKSP